MSTIRKLLMAQPSTSGFGSQVVYGSTTTTGAVSFTVPAGVTSISVLVVDGGASGASGSSGNVDNFGPGGPGGLGGSRRYINDLAVTPGQVITGIIGAPGGASSFGSFPGWVDAPRAGSGLNGTPGVTSDRLPCGGVGGGGGGAASLIDAGAVGPNSSSGFTSDASGSPGANGVWPGGGGGGGGGGAGGRTPQGTGFIGNGGAGGSGSNGAIRIIWPGNIRRYPAENTEDWSLGEAGKWDEVLSTFVTLYAVAHGFDQTWYATGTTGANIYKSLNNGQDWVLESTNAVGATNMGVISSIASNSTKTGAKGVYVHLKSHSGGGWFRGFSGLQVGSGDSNQGVFASSDSGVWVCGVRVTREISISRDDGITRNSSFTMPGSLVPQQAIWLGGSRWIILTLGAQALITDDDFITTRLVSALPMRQAATAASNGAGIIIAPVDNNLLMRSIDNGETWAYVSVSDISPIAISCNKNTGVWVLVGDSGALMVSNDNGITFNSVPSGVSPRLWSVSNNESGTWCACGASGKIIRSIV